ncbi:MAG: hypothetical protein AB1657_05680 [Candidatus Micrarchaeota archaeon]
MAPPAKILVFDTADTMEPARPFDTARLPGKAGRKPAPDGIKSNRDLFYEDQCSAHLVRFYDSTRVLSERMKDAFGISSCLPKTSNEDLAEECILALSETMQDDSEHPSLRMACAIAIGSSGIEHLATIMERVLKSDSSIPSKILALKALSIARTEEALQLLTIVAKYGDVDEVCFAAAKELASLPLYQARKAAESILDSLPEAYIRHPEFAAELRRLLAESPIN